MSFISSIVHHQFICKVFEHNSQIKPLPGNDNEIRENPAKSLPLLYGSLIFNQIDETRQILKEFPDQKMALIIHKINHTNHYITLVRHADIICVECTLVHQYCIDYNLYKKVLLSPDAVMIYI